MKPSREDVVRMIVPLMKIVGNIDRARKQGDAATLSAMNVIAMKGQVRPLDIATALGVHQSTVTRQIRSLEEDGLVSVVEDETDRRSCRVSLSEKGISEFQRLSEFGISRFELMVEDWTPQEVQELGRLLVKLGESSDNLGHKTPPATRRSWQGRRS